MRFKDSVKEEILNALTDVGGNGATITEISRKVGRERHTLSKYVYHLKKEGCVTFKPIGKAKVWYVNNNSIANLCNCNQPTSSEKALLEILSKSPVGIAILDKDFRIQFMNEIMTDRYGKAVGELFYQRILGQKNPLNLKELREIIDAKAIYADEFSVNDKFGNSLSIKASKVVNEEAGLSLVLIAHNINPQAGSISDI